MFLMYFRCFHDMTVYAVCPSFVSNQNFILMARLSTGVIGQFSGAVGPVIGSTWRGIPYMKARHKTRTTRVSDGEKENRNKFTMAHYWLKPLLKVVREGFKNYSQKSFGFNAAKSYLLKNAIEGEGSNVYVNPALVKLSAGDLVLPDGIAVEKTGPAEFTVTWDPAIKSKTNAEDFDQAMVVAYNPEQEVVCTHITGQFRKTGSHKQPVAPGLTYHLYLAFLAADRSRQSDSVYLGEMDMS